MLELFDSYEIRARLAPTLLVFLPLAVPAAVALNAVQLSFAQTGLWSVGLLVSAYGASFWVRSAARRREKQLWVSWGGPPSTLVVLSDTDDTFSQDLRRRILAKVEERFGIPVNTDTPDQASRQVDDAFKLVKKRVSQLDRKGLWTKHNAEYGFLRNLWGSVRIWVGADVVATGLCASMWLGRVSSWAPIATLVCAACIPIILMVHRFVLPGLLKGAAFRYAESAWVSFLHGE